MGRGLRYGAPMSLNPESLQLRPTFCRLHNWARRHMYCASVSPVEVFGFLILEIPKDR